MCVFALTGRPKPPGRKGLFDFRLVRDGVKTRDLRRDGRGSGGRTGEFSEVKLAMFPRTCIVSISTFSLRFVL